MVAALGREKNTITIAIVHLDAFECNRRVRKWKWTVRSKDARRHTGTSQALEYGVGRVLLCVGGNACIPALSA